MKQTKDCLKELLRELTGAVGVSGQEQEVVKLVYKKIKPHADEVRVSPTGNIIAIKRGKKEGPNLLIAAHTDEIGYGVKTVLPNGFLLIEKIGFPPDNIMLGRKVYVSAKRIPGIIGVKPGHLMAPDEDKTIPHISKCYVDLGLSSAEQVRELGIKAGDAVVIQSDFMEMANPDLVCSRAVDNRVNCAVLIELFRSLNPEEFSGTIYGAFTVREETGLHGARTAAFGLPINYAIALDTIPAGDTPDVATAVQLPVYLGKGPVIPIADNILNISFQFVHPGIRKFIESAAAKNNIPLQSCTLLGYTYATDASAISYVGMGIPTCTLAVPRRYSHSPVELVNLNDAAGSAALLKAVADENHTVDLRFVDLEE